MNPSSLPVQQRIALLVQALDGAEKTNKALATCPDGDAMVDILLGCHLYTSPSPRDVGISRMPSSA